MSVDIRPLSTAHAGELVTVQRAAYLAEARRYAAWDLPPLVETLRQVEDHIASGQPALGAFDGHRLVGSVRGNVDGDRMEVARLFVAPDQQGRGIGRRLLDAAAGATPSGVDVLWLFTGARSEENLRLYESAGFVRVGERVDGLGITLVTLERKVI
ncbi:N-acetyltransferase [Nocardia sp. NRRL S-836]|uniref:GNAT family N-acetyltransferase n=1 Tax=Nocardia sp. NRRL S-836 TaxID=1519492 RepID=UPI0006B05956|nr:GNAT family N-acetyltransferase [Nocardia sp. NRRL S-836]